MSTEHDHEHGEAGAEHWDAAQAAAAHDEQVQPSTRQSPSHGLGAGGDTHDADSPSHGLGSGGDVHGADSPAHGLGSADPTGHETPGTGTPVQAAGTPERGTGADDGAEDRDRR